MRENSTPCTVKIAGIQIHYCDDNDRRHKVWVDLENVEAIAWTHKEIGPKRLRAGLENTEGEKKAAASRSEEDDDGGCEKIPGGDPPDSCQKLEGMMARSLCWWDGRRWICGEA